MKTGVSLIVAVAENYVIGKNNNLIWHLPDDMQFFKIKTCDHHVITGRKNYESIPEKYRPLSNRTNIVVTHKVDYQAEGTIVKNSITDAIATALKNGDNEPFIIGGGQIYKGAIEKNIVDRMYITHVHHSFDGDTFFPKPDFSLWKKTEELFHPADKQHRYSFTLCTYQKIVL